MLYRHFFICLPVLLIGQACFEYGDPVAPLKVGSISEKAIWIGGIDGGRWIECSLVQEEKAHLCTIWEDQQGHMVVRKFFVDMVTGLAIPEADFDILGVGGRIGLTNGQQLVPREVFLDRHIDWRRSPVDPPWNPPARPEGVSEAAIWAGDRPGETAWIECSIDLEQDANFCTVWNDQDGGIVTQGYFTLVKNWGATHAPAKMLKYYAGFDGANIALWTDAVLEPKSKKVKGDENRD